MAREEPSSKPQGVDGLSRLDDLLAQDEPDQTETPWEEEIQILMES